MGRCVLLLDLPSSLHNSLEHHLSLKTRTFLSYTTQNRLFSCIMMPSRYTASPSSSGESIRRSSSIQTQDTHKTLETEFGTLTDVESNCSKRDPVSDIETHPESRNSPRKLWSFITVKVEMASKNLQAQKNHANLARQRGNSFWAAIVVAEIMIILFVFLSQFRGMASDTYML